MSHALSDAASSPGGFEPRLGDRALFPDLEFRAYFAHAAISPVSRPVRLMTERFVADVARRGAASFLDWEQERRALRARFATLLGVESHQVALTAGTTHGITALALALPLRAGDEIIGFLGEFPANVIPYQKAIELAQAKLTLLEAPDPCAREGRARILKGVEARLRAGARYVAVSAVQFQTGYRMPLAELGELCKRYDAFLLVDAIQAVGVVPLNAKELHFDALFVGAHKWLLGLEGAGMLFCSDRLRERLVPRTTGWLSLLDGEAFLFQGANRLRYEGDLHPDARVFEGSTSNAIGLAALSAGLSICEALGPAAIYQHVQGIHDALEEALVPLGFRSLRAQEPDGRSCILSFALPAGLALPELARGLRERGIMVSTPDGLLRFAPHFANSLEEIPHVAASFKELTGA